MTSRPEVIRPGLDPEQTKLALFGLSAVLDRADLSKWLTPDEREAMVYLYEKLSTVYRFHVSRMEAKNIALSKPLVHESIVQDGPLTEKARKIVDVGDLAEKLATYNAALTAEEGER